MARLYLAAFLCLALALHVAADCRPCQATDGAQCTHPGNANTAWCQSRCTAGVNNAICPASHCYCTGSSPVPRRCSPCTQGDVGCTQPGVASQAWCDQRCTTGVNNELCPVDLCKCSTGKGAGRDKFTALASADDCRPCKTSDGAQCTHPGNANVAWCKSRCTTGKNTNICPATHCWCKGSTSVPSKCSPCSKGDSGCTQPGVASQAWCDSRCQKGVNNDLCPKTLCKCPAAKVSGKERMEETLAAPAPAAPKCRPCKKTDGSQCTHPGNADQKWCDQHCPKGKNDEVCVSSFCWCPGSTPVPSKCTPCKKGDSGCTNPGNADQAWCDANCDKGVNTLQCPKSHCKCPVVKGTGLKTEQRTETTLANADEKTSSAKTHNQSAMWGALGLGLGCVALVSLVAAVVVRKRSAAPQSLPEELE